MCFFIRASTLVDVDLELALSGVDCQSLGGGVDENEYLSSYSGDVGAGGSTADDSGLATITNGGNVIIGAIVGTEGDAVVDDTAGAVGTAAGALDGLGDDAGGAPVDDGVLLVPIMVPMLVVDADGAAVDVADGAAVDVAAGASDAVDGAPPVDDGIMVPLSAVVVDGATVDDGISVDDTNGVSIDEGSIDGAGGAAVDDGSVDEADGASIDEEISGGGGLEVLALVPIGGGVVDAVASIVPVGAGTC